MFQNDPQMAQMMVDEEELKAKETEKAENDLRRPSIVGEDRVSGVLAKLINYEKEAA